MIDLGLITILTGFFMKKNNTIVALIALWTAVPLVCQAGTFHVTPSVSAKEEYNDNILFEANDTMEDFITTVVPQLELVEKTEKLALGITSTLEAIDYMDNDNLNAIDHAQKGHLAYKATPRMSYSANAEYKQDSRSDRDLQTTGLLLNTSKRELFAGSAGAQYIMTEKLSTLFNMSFHNDHFEDPTMVDAEIYGVSGGFAYNLGTYLPQTIGRMTLDHNRFEYPTDRVKNYGVSMGLSHDLTETYAVSVDIGPRYSESDFAGQTEDDISVSGALGLDYTGETTKANLTLSRDERAVSGEAGTAERSSLSLSVSRKFFEELRCGLGLEYHNNKSQASTSSQDIDEDAFSFVPTIRYSFTQDLSLDGNYRHTHFVDRAVRTGEETRERNLVYVRLNYQHPLFD